MRCIAGLIICGMAMPAWGSVIELDAVSSPTPRHELLDPAVQLPVHGVVISHLLDGRLVTRAIDPITGTIFGPFYVFMVHRLDRLVAESLNQQVRYQLKTNLRRGKGEGHFPLVMELEHQGHRRPITVRHLPRERIALENQGKLVRYQQTLDL